MKIRSIIAAAIAAAVIPLAAQASSPAEGGEVIFFEDFSAETPIPDPAVWKLCTYGNNVWARYFANTERYANVKVENGTLVLTAEKRDGLYTTGGIRTIKGFPAGTMLEVRARMTTPKGGFPAIWQMPVNGRQWPVSGEVDVMEWVQSNPQSVYQTVHTQYLKQTAGDTGCTKRTDDIDTAEYHIYAAARTAEAVIFYIDGVETSRYENQHLVGSEGELQFPFTLHDYDIILNYSFGGEFNGGPTWAGPIDDSELPATMWVDWVRVTKID